MNLFCQEKNRRNQNNLAVKTSTVSSSELLLSEPMDGNPIKRNGTILASPNTELKFSEEGNTQTQSIPFRLRKDTIDDSNNFKLNLSPN